MRGKRSVSFVACFTIVSVVALFLACSSPEEKRAKFFTKGKALYEEKDYRKARVEFKNALQVDPKFADGYYWLGKVELALQNLRGAFGNFKKAAELNPNLTDAQIGLGRILLLAREPDKALEKAELVLNKDKSNTDALLLKANALAAKKDFSGALDIVHGITASSPKTAEAYLVGAACQAALNKPDAAEAMLQAGIRAVPDKAILYHSLAQYYVSRKRLADAEQIYRQVATLQPKEAGHRQALARLYLMQGSFDRAETELRAIVGIDADKEEYLLPLAVFLGGRGRFTESENLMKSFIQKKPDASYKVRFVLADLYLKNRQTDKALAVLQDAADLAPKNPNAVTAKNSMAAIYAGQGKSDEALKLTREILENNPGDVAALVTQGRVSLVKKDAVNAVNAFRSLVKEAPKNPEAHVLLGQAHRLNKDYALAEEEFKKALSLNEKYAPASEALGDLYVEKKDLARAEKVFEELSAKYPKDPRWSFKLGVLYEMKGDTGRALSSFDKALKANVDYIPALAQIVQIHFRRKEPQKGLSAVQRQVGASPRNPILRDMLGEVAARVGNAKLATGAFEKAIELKPDWLQPYHNLALLYVDQDQPAKAIETLQKAQKIRPQDERTLFYLGNAYERKGEADKARSIYEDLLKKKPDDVAVANNLAYLYANAYPTKDNLARALQLVQGGLAKQPDHPGLVDTLGWIYFKQGRIAEAEKELGKALAKAPQSPDLNYHMGMILASKGDRAGAQRALKAALASGRPFVGRDNARETLGKL